MVMKYSILEWNMLEGALEIGLMNIRQIWIFMVVRHCPSWFIR